MPVSTPQAKLYTLKQLLKRVKKTYESSMSSAQISEAIACVSPPNAATAAVFSKIMFWLVCTDCPIGCPLVVSSGALPILFECLRSWPADQKTMNAACLALHWLVVDGSVDVKQAVRDVPDCEQQLRAAQATGLDKDEEGFSMMARMLRRLSLYAQC